MPLYDFKCRACGHAFEALVRAADTEGPACGACGTRDVDRLLSTFAVKSEDRTREFATANRKRAAAIARRDNIAADIEAARHRAEDH